MKCEKHPDRDGILTVDLPSIGIRRAMCLECRAAFQLGLDKMVSNDPMPAWERASRQGVPDKNDMYPSRSHGTTREGKAAGAVEWKHYPRGIH